MNDQQKVLAEIEKMILELPAAQREDCIELANHFRESIKSAGSIVGPLAIAFVGAEMAAQE